MRNIVQERLEKRHPYTRMTVSIDPFTAIGIGSQVLGAFKGMKNQNDTFDANNLINQQNFELQRENFDFQKQLVEQLLGFQTEAFDRGKGISDSLVNAATAPVTTGVGTRSSFDPETGFTTDLAPIQQLIASSILGNQGVTEPVIRNEAFTRATGADNIVDQILGQGQATQNLDNVRANANLDARSSVSDAFDNARSDILTRGAQTNQSSDSIADTIAALAVEEAGAQRSQAPGRLQTSQIAKADARETDATNFSNAGRLSQLAIPGQTGTPMPVDDLSGRIQALMPQTAGVAASALGTVPNVSFTGTAPQQSVMPLNQSSSHMLNSVGNLIGSLGPSNNIYNRHQNNQGFGARTAGG